MTQDDKREASDPAEDAAVEKILGQGPAGPFAVAGLATAIVVLIFFAFYFIVYLPRGAVQ